MSEKNIFSEYIESLEKQEYLSKKTNLMEKMYKGMGVLSNVVNVTGGVLGCVGAGISVCLPESKQQFIGLGFSLGSIFASGYISGKLDKTQEYVGGRITALVDEWNRAELKQKEIEEQTLGLQSNSSNTAFVKENVMQQDVKQCEENVDDVLESVVFEEELEQLQETGTEELINIDEQNVNNASIIAKQIIDNRQITLEE